MLYVVRCAVARCALHVCSIRCTLYAVRLAPVQFALYVERCTLHVAPDTPHNRCGIGFIAHLHAPYTGTCGKVGGWCGGYLVGGTLQDRQFFNGVRSPIIHIYEVSVGERKPTFFCVWVKAELSCGTVLCVSRQTPRSSVVLQYRVATYLAWQKTLFTL